MRAEIRSSRVWDDPLTRRFRLLLTKAMTGYEDVVHAGDCCKGEGRIQENPDQQGNPGGMQYLRQHDKKHGCDLAGRVDFTEDAWAKVTKSHGGVQHDR